MADIELVIKIDEEIYNGLKSLPFTTFPEDIIKNGIPLDKIRERISLEKLGYPPSAGYYKAIIKVLKIIDKYTAESEE